MEALGASDLSFLEGVLDQLVRASTKNGVVDEKALNTMLAMVKSVEPRDQVEAMLAAQMAAVHTMAMTFAFRLNHIETIPQQDSAERAFNKLTRTFTTQMEALRKYRRGGEQRMTVEQVTVKDGGQAIVGNVARTE